VVGCAVTDGIAALDIAPRLPTIELTIKGQPCSLKNSRQMAHNAKTGLWFPVPSKEAKKYLRELSKQVPIREPLLTCRLRVLITIYYASERPDLDESIILDGLQTRIYKNDRQVREKHIYHKIDKANPRAEIVIEPFQGDLLMELSEWDPAPPKSGGAAPRDLNDAIPF